MWAEVLAADDERRDATAQQGEAHLPFGVVLAAERHVADQVGWGDLVAIDDHPARAALLLGDRAAGGIGVTKPGAGLLGLGRCCRLLGRTREVWQREGFRPQVECLVVLLAHLLRLVTTHVLCYRAPISKAILQDSVKEPHLLVCEPVLD